NDAAYDDTAVSSGRDRVPALMGTILRKRIRMQGFIILDHYATGYAPFLKEMSEWVAQGQVKTLEDVIPDLADAPNALIGLLAGAAPVRELRRPGRVRRAPRKPALHRVSHQVGRMVLGAARDQGAVGHRRGRITRAEPPPRLAPPGPGGSRRALRGGDEQPG